MPLLLSSQLHRPIDKKVHVPEAGTFSLSAMPPHLRPMLTWLLVLTSPRHARAASREPGNPVGRVEPTVTWIPRFCGWESGHTSSREANRGLSYLPRKAGFVPLNLCMLTTTMASGRMRTRKNPPASSQRWLTVAVRDLMYLVPLPRDGTGGGEHIGERNRELRPNRFPLLHPRISRKRRLEVKKFRVVLSACSLLFPYQPPTPQRLRRSGCLVLRPHTTSHRLFGPDRFRSRSHDLSPRIDGRQDLQSSPIPPPSIPFSLKTFFNSIAPGVTRPCLQRSQMSWQNPWPHSVLPRRMYSFS
jgi:hypothetical protein